MGRINGPAIADHKGQRPRPSNHRIDPLSDERLISGSDDHTIRLWDMKTSREMAQVNMGDSIARLTLSPDGKFLACALPATGLRIWRLSDVFPVLDGRRTNVADASLHQRKSETGPVLAR